MTFADWLQAFILGAAFGFSSLFGLVLYFIHLDDKSRALKKAAREYRELYPEVSPELALQIVKGHNN